MFCTDKTNAELELNLYCFSVNVEGDLFRS